MWVWLRRGGYVLSFLQCFFFYSTLTADNMTVLLYTSLRVENVAQECQSYIYNNYIHPRIWVSEIIQEPGDVSCQNMQSVGLHHIHTYHSCRAAVRVKKSQ